MAVVSGDLGPHRDRLTRLPSSRLVPDPKLAP
jgi:hypothetical protein